MDKLIGYFSGKYLAAWVILASDAVLVFISYVLATILRYNFELKLIDFDDMMLHSAVTMVFYVTTFSISRTSSAVLRHSGLNDLIKVVKSGFIACAILVAIAAVLLYGYQYRGVWLIPKSTLIIQFLLASLLLSLSRLIAKATYAAFLRNNSDLKTKILIFGAGESGRITCQTLLSGRFKDREIVTVAGFADDNPSLQGKSLEGLPIFSPDQVFKSDFIEKHGISQVVLSVQNITSVRRREITDVCLSLGVEIREIPPHDRWIDGQLTIKQIQPVKIENLLGRSEISLDSENIERELSDKVILVTGGAGSIGSELTRQALHFHSRLVIVLDQAESAMHDLEIALKSEIRDHSRFELIVGSINDPQRLRSIFEKFRPNLVFHAAAYKHVPMMESNPYEAVSTNIFGTKQVADMAIEFQAEKFVLVSTDKAINPTNVMGATKRAAEMYTQTLRGTSETSFIITRFGNVLGSTGSVIPLFKKQIESGGPVTITHEEITRFFMTISEACNLVLEAGSMGNDGEIFVFDMGDPIRIYDLAAKMIQLSGLEVEKDVRIVTIGLRPGEKLYEEVLANEENTLPTHHEKILKAHITELDTARVNKTLEELSGHLQDVDGLEAVRCLKELVPEFRSNNSRFELLDAETKASDFQKA